ncbi:MAG TPA: hypothetical protein VMO26_27735 [Vicinamibacterales bacterium]|nr:hypothetical protein [Vicinamibacterales bacterium]
MARRVTVDLPASARSFQASTRDAPAGVWFVRVAARIPGHGVTTPSNELQVVIP